VGSEKNIKYNNLKKQLHKQRDIKQTGSMSSKQNIMGQQMVNNFALAINEVTPDEQIQQPKDHEYSPLFKDFQ